tara:strand:- start:138 stop:512 length:375 start_codon:yes stop_codon:yes gene_type:complete
MPKRICPYPGCTILVLEARCKKHSKEKYGTPRSLSESREFYWSKEWRKIRRYHLNRHPLCQIKRICTGVPGNEVDHIVPIEAGGDKLNPDNLQTACKRCHSWKTFNVDIKRIHRYKEKKREQIG